MFDKLVAQYHLHPIVDHFTIALLAFGIAMEVAGAAAGFLAGAGITRLAGWKQRLSNASLPAFVAGAVAALGSYFTGDAEADRLWDTMSPAAQNLLAAGNGLTRHLSHAVLGQDLMYAFAVLALWRLSIELWSQVARWRVMFLMASVLGLAAILYQGKTGGDLVYGYGVGTPGSPARIGDSR